MSDDRLARLLMTHQPEQQNPVIEEINRRLNLTGQNLYNTWIAPAQRLGEAATSGTLDVTNPQTAGDAFGLVGGLAGARMPFARAGELGSAGGKPITAYHGSPHDFDRFDFSKMGTGEGAQAYGAGGYFAENPAVAESYKQGGFQHLPEAVSVAEDNDRWAVYVGGRKKALTYAGKDEANAAAAQIAKEIGPKGKMYEVAINADPEHFLDWDKPLSEQSGRARAALEKYDPEYPYVMQRLFGDKWQNRTVAELMENVIGDLPNASKGLAEAGIPGIKYLDQQSRVQPLPVFDPVQQTALNTLTGARDVDHAIRILKNEKQFAAAKLLESGWRPPEKQPTSATRNYVVFDDKLIDIIKKYGLAGLLSGGT